MTENGALLESVIDHAARGDGDFDDIEPAVEELTGSGDVSLVPRLIEALDRSPRSTSSGTRTRRRAAS